jgi:hypothetical protein
VIQAYIKINKVLQTVLHAYQEGFKLWESNWNVFHAVLGEHLLMQNVKQVVAHARLVHFKTKKDQYLALIAQVENFKTKKDQYLALIANLEDRLHELAGTFRAMYALKAYIKINKVLQTVLHAFQARTKINKNKANALIALVDVQATRSNVAAIVMRVQWENAKSVLAVSIV